MSIKQQNAHAKVMLSGEINRAVNVRGIACKQRCACRDRSRRRQNRGLGHTDGWSWSAGLTGGLGDLGKLTELRQRIFFVLGAILVFRIGSFIPLPGIDPRVLAALVEQQKGTILDMFNMFSGGALSRLSLFALGIMPYISASIIMQLMTIQYPRWSR